MPFCPICLKIEYVVLLGTPDNVSMGMNSIRPCPWHPGALKLRMRRYSHFCPICLKIEYVVLFSTTNNVSMGLKSIRPCPWHPGALKPSIALYPVRLEL